MKKIVMLMILLLVLTSCKQTKDDSKNKDSHNDGTQLGSSHQEELPNESLLNEDTQLENEEDTMDTQKSTATYEQISQKEAKDIIDKEKDFVILDVRTQDEYDTSHIDGAIVLPLNEVKEKAKDVLTDKDQVILVYCRSGVRSKQAAEELVNLGYTKIKEFGGIIDWPYEVVR